MVSLVALLLLIIRMINNVCCQNKDLMWCANLVTDLTVTILSGQGGEPASDIYWITLEARNILFRMGQFVVLGTLNLVKDFTFLYASNISYINKTNRSNRCDRYFNEYQVDLRGFKDVSKGFSRFSMSFRMFPKN